MHAVTIVLPLKILFLFALGCNNQLIRAATSGKAPFVGAKAVAYRWLVDEGLTVNAITYRLRALGVPTPGRSQFWRNSTVHEILTNPAYTGKTYAFTYSYAEPRA